MDVLPGRPDRGARGQDRAGVDAGRGQHDLAERRHRLVRRGGHGCLGLGVPERASQARLVRLGEVEIPLGQQRTDQRVAVGMEPGRRQPHDRVAGTDRRPVDDVGALDDADAATRQVEGIDLHQPGVLGGLAADQRAAGIATAGRHRTDQLRDPLGHDPADRDVIEERERLRAAADDVVGAHRDEVDADRVEAPERGGDRRLRADAVGRRHEQRLAVARRDPDRAAEATETADDLPPMGRLDGAPHQVDGALPRRDVDAGRPIGVAARRAPRSGHRASPGTGSSSTNLRLAASYGTGSG